MLKLIPCLSRSFIQRQHRYQKKVFFLSTAIVAIICFTIILDRTSTWQDRDRDSIAVLQQTRISERRQLSQEDSDYKQDISGKAQNDKSTINSYYPIVTSNDFTVREKDCLWVNRTKDGPPYFLTALVLLRIFKESEKRAKFDNQGDEPVAGVP